MNIISSNERLSKVYDKFSRLKQRNVRAAFATEFLGGIIGGDNLAINIANLCISVDTIRIAVETPPRPPVDVLRVLGFGYAVYRKQKKKSPFRSTWFLNIQLPNCKIRVHWSIAPDGRHWLSVECSLPRFVYGSNLYGLSWDASLVAVDNLSAIVSIAVGITVNLRRGHFTRLDIFLNLYLVSDKAVNATIAALRCLKVDRRRLLAEIWKTTVTFRSPAGSHELSGYNKTREVRKKTGCLARTGVLRIESRYLNSQLISWTAAKKLGCRNRVETMLESENLEALFYLHLPK